MNPVNTDRSYYPALDGLRGVAILLVVFYHNFNFIPIFNYGWLGVDLFFVLSGFLITDILLGTMNTRNYFRNFYARRVLRIFPLYYLSLLLFLVILPLFSKFPLDVSYYQHNQWWFWTYLQNWTLIFHYDGKATALNHFWSLAVEEQYYLVWPFIILLIRKPRRLLLFCLLALITVIAARLYIWNHRTEFPSYEWLFLFTRIDGILIGSMLALVYYINQSVLRKYSTALILLLAGSNFIIYFLHKTPDFPVWPIAGFTTFAAIFALLVYESIKKENKVIHFIFTNPVLQFLGKYSYGFYIFHWPVFLLMKPYTDWLTERWFEAGNLNQLIISATLATLAGLSVSVLSYHLFEKHFLMLKKYFTGV
jgi:peptidoglycan/LPS O-acetylase OafA/YrhL